MKKIKTEFKGLLVFENKNYKDSRGFLREIYKKSSLKKIFVLITILFPKKMY